MLTFLIQYRDSSEALRLPEGEAQALTGVTSSGLRQAKREPKMDQSGRVFSTLAIYNEDGSCYCTPSNR